MYGSDFDPYLPGGPDWQDRVDALAADLKALGADCVVAAPFNRTAVDDALLWALGDVRRIGLQAPADAAADLPLTDVVRVDEGSSELDKNRALFAAASGAAEDLPPPRLLVGPAERAAARRVLEGLGVEAARFAVGAPAGTVTTALKAWPAHDFARVVAHLDGAHGLGMVMVGVEREAAHLHAIAAQARALGAASHVWTGGPGDLGTLLGLVAESRLYVGSDSGPMHFAAALDVPVFARFGGGHWPRFLPAARRGRIATQKLPCFGCGWTCWLPAAACVQAVSHETVVRGIDELLRGGTGLTVDEGRALDAFTSAAIADGAARYRATEAAWRTAAGREQASARLLAFSEADRAARLAVIEDQHRQLADARAAQVTHQAAIAQVERLLREQQAQVAALTQRAAYLSSADGAIRVLGLSVLHRLGLYRLVTRYRPLVERGLRFVSRPAPAADVPPLPARPTLFEALAVVNALASGGHELAQERLYALGTLLGRVLCLGPSPRVAAAAYMTASGGAQATLLEAATLPPELRVQGLTEETRDLGRLLADDPGALRGLGALVVDDACDPDTLLLLTARLDRGTAVFAVGEPPPTLPPCTHAGDVPGLHAFEEAPAGWVAGRPATLPSGRPWPRFTVVTVSYNHAAFLEDTLRSVLDQDYPDLEYIVIDGGSRDGTAAILDRYRDRLSYCVSEPDRGQSHALNKGFARATGTLCAWLNSDDRYAPDALWRAALAFDLHGADLVAGGCALAEEPHGRIARVHHSALPIGRPVPLPADRLLDLDGAWLRGDFFFQPEVFWTRDLWQRAGGRVAEELHYSMDYELWVRFARQGARVVHVPDTLALYRVHPNQKTAGPDLPYLPELRRVARDLQPAGAERS
ncbi:MAG: glycosyltransferase [Vicinamibacteria bacterium]